MANESSDVVSKVAYSPASGARVVAEIPVGLMHFDVDAPHGLVVAESGEYWYVSLAHGTPYGSVWKFAAAGDTLVGRVQLGRFPASMTLSPDEQFLFVSNFNIHGEHVPSSISVVHTPTMLEVARPTTCVMPHGGRIDASGTRHFSTCMHSDQLVELDLATFQVTARTSLVPGREGPLPLDDTGNHDPAHGPVEPACAPTWATPGRAAFSGNVYVTCNRAGTVLEVDIEEQAVRRRFEVGPAPYNMETSPDGRWLLVTLRGGQSLVIIDLESGAERGRITTSRPITHGVVGSPDGRYAFVTNEAVGSTRGTLDVVDLGRLRLVATVELAHQPGGLDLWTPPLDVRAR